MPWTLDEALNDQDVTVVHRDDAAGNYVVRIGSIPTNVTINLRRRMSGGMIDWQQSHAIKTPLQAGPYWTSKSFDDDAAYALHRAVDSLTSYYRSAVDAGHTPDESWLKQSGQF